MSQKRQDAIFEPLRDRQSQVTTLTHDYPAGHVIRMHFHDRDQLAYASQGAMTVLTSVAIWVVHHVVRGMDVLRLRGCVGDLDIGCPGRKFQARKLGVLVSICTDGCDVYRWRE